MTFQEKILWAGIIIFVLVTTLSVMLIIAINRVIEATKKTNPEKLNPEHK